MPFFTSLPVTRARVLVILAFPSSILCRPLHSRSTSIVSVDPSPDAWAEALSGIGPLILLVGERATKQVLRGVRGFSDALSFSAAPLGLISVVTSLIRLCGYQLLRALIGYELEARAVAAVDITRVNCGGVHAEVIDGYLSRSTTARPASRAIGVLLLESKNSGGQSEALAQIRSCREFEETKRLHGITDEVARTNWVLQMVAEENIFSIVKILYQAVGVDNLSEERIRKFCNASHKGWGETPDPGEKVPFTEPSASSPNNKISEYSERMHSKESEFSAYMSDARQQQSDQIQRVRTVSTGIFSLNKTDPTAAPTISVGCGELLDVDDPSAELTFMCTINSISEFAAVSPTSRLFSAILGVTSLVAIIGIYVLSMWQDGWQANYGLIIAISGYFGVFFSVTSAAMIIQTSCICIPLRTRSSIYPALWKDGLVISVENTDSQDTGGSDLMQSSSEPQNFELVYLRKLTRARKVAASLTAAILVMSFVVHYLGLRSSRWFVSMGELGICILGATWRSMAGGRQVKFNITEGVKIDKRCASTGIIRVKKSRRIDKQDSNENRLDARSYSPLLWRQGARPTDGEDIAWHVAKLCFRDKNVVSRILELTGMHIDVHFEADRHNNGVAVVVHYNGGLLVKEGLASPGRHLCLSFQSGFSDLSRPTALLGRGIMRQPEWVVERSDLGTNIPLGNVYMLSINSIMDWWTLSEDRNDAEDLARNIEWCFLLINMAFYLELMRLQAEGTNIGEVEVRFSREADRDMEVVRNVANFWKTTFENEIGSTG